MLIAVAFSIVAVTLIFLHPTFADMRMLAANDGTLNLSVQPLLLLGGAALIAVASVSSVMLLRPLAELDKIVVSSLVASVILALIQLGLLLTFQEGSWYALKKHMFIVVPLAILNIARLIPRGLKRINPWPRLDFVIAVAGGFCVTASILDQAKGISVRRILKPLNFAETAVATGFPRFSPGNTAVVASTVDAVTRYMISLAVFRMPFDAYSTSMLIGEFDPSKSQYLMVDRSEAVINRCPERYADNNEYTIVPTDCLMTFPANQTISFGLGNATDLFLKSGWWPQEAWGVWSKGKTSTLRLRLPPELRQKSLRLQLDLQVFNSPRNVSLTVSGKKYELGPINSGILELVVPSSAVGDGVLEIQFVVHDAMSPKSGIDKDRRGLGIGLKSVTLTQANA